MDQIIFFDGVCNLCNNSIDFIMKRDRRGVFKFASLQSKVARRLLEDHHFDIGDMTTLVLLKQGRLYTRSRAALEICRQLNGMWPLLYIFILVPYFLRDSIYNWVSGNRYRWFGKRDTCRIPQKHERQRFLTDKSSDTAPVG